MKVRQTRNDLLRHLAEQVMFLRSSSKSYDDGYEGEAKRLATVIRVLVHDTSNSKSLLGQLGVIGNMDFYDTAWNFDPNNLLNHNGLTAMRIDNEGAKYVAPLDTRRFQGVWVAFTSWWNKVVFVDDEKYSFTRKKSCFWWQTKTVALILTLSSMRATLHYPVGILWDGCIVTVLLKNLYQGQNYPQYAKLHMKY